MWGMSSGLPCAGPPVLLGSPRKVQNVLSCDIPMIEEGPWSFSCETRTWWGMDKDSIDSCVGTAGAHQDCARKPAPFRAHWIVWPPEWWMGIQGSAGDRRGRGSCAFPVLPAGVSIRAC